MPKRSKAVKEMDIELSKNGIPCIWEQGEGKRHTGEAVVICNSNGGRKKALFVNRKKGLSCREHALIPIRVSDIIIDIVRYGQKFSMEILTIVEIDKAFKTAYCRRVEYSEKYDKAIKVAEKKTLQYNNEVMYIR